MVWLLMFASIVYLLGDVPQRAGNEAARPHVELTQLARYSDDRVYDVSADGRLMLVQSSKIPVETYRLQLAPGGGISSAERTIPPRQLRVVEIASGKELGRLGIPRFPDAAKFVPGSTLVVFLILDQRRSKAFRWDWERPETGAREVKNEEPGLAVWGLQVQSAEAAFSARTALPEKEQRSVIVEWKPSDGSETRQAELGGSYIDELTMSADGKMVAVLLRRDYTGRRDLTGWVEVRATSDLSVLTGIKEGPGEFFRRAVLSPGGKEIAVIGHVRERDAAGWGGPRETIWVFGALDGKLHRRFPLSADSAVEWSVDGRYLAVGRKTERRRFGFLEVQAECGLYDVSTGEEAARVVHAWTREPRNNPWAGQMSVIRFTPDGKFLLTSTGRHETMVWRVATK